MESNMFLDQKTFQQEQTSQQEQTFQQEQAFPTNSLNEFSMLCLKLLKGESLSEEQIVFSLEHCRKMMIFFIFLQEGSLIRKTIKNPSDEQKKQKLNLNDE